MLEKNRDFQLITKAFLKFTIEQFKIDKPSTKLENWYELDFFDFIKELEKKKIKLSSSDKFDLKPLFEREKLKALEIKSIIDQTDNEIDRMVYELYELTVEEIRIVEGK